MDEAPQHGAASGVSRRRFLRAAGGLVGGGALVGAGRELAPALDPGPGVPDQGVVHFYGEHQAGVVTTPQRQSYFAALDVVTDERRELASLMQRWTVAAAALCEGAQVGTAEALGLGPARLSVNFGFGPSLFGVGGPDRFGLGGKWP
ncbi:MAG TPA: Dyp-type peroxidase domain-containing protein, partial [Acidimicrobiales bacterium]|nr:Dyp-type peroxidase domain-containing protein [Acidimicrobiales bacterium]